MAVHALQAPAPSQTRLLPHAVPAVLGAPSTHVCTPVAQLVTPARQVLLGLVVQV